MATALCASRRAGTGRSTCAILAFVVAAVATLLAPNAGRAADPDFGSVSDILGGQRFLMRDDDLVVSGGFGGSSMPSVLTMRTADSNVSPPARNDFQLQSGDAKTAVGRMFGIANDVVATLVLGRSGNATTFGVRIVDPVKSTTAFTPIPGSATSVNAIAMADFTGDGYADVVVEYTASSGNDVLIVGTAADVTNVAAGLTWGPPLSVPTSRFFELAIGDFDGNGQPEVAAALLDANLATNVVIYTVARDTRAVARAGSTVFPDFLDSERRWVSLAAGRFGTASHDQLVLAAAGILQNFRVMTIDMNGLQPVQTGHVLRPGIEADEQSLARVRSVRIDWFGERDQVALLLVPSSAPVQLSILTFDDALNISQGPIVDPDLDCYSDIAIGNFDRMQPNPSPPPARERNPNLQLALLGSNCSSTLWLSIYEVDPSSLRLTSSSGGVFPLPGDVGPAGMSIVAGDTQGRSLPLGPPTKVTVTGSIQPQVILGVPPMHVDYVCDAATLGPRCTPSVLNVTARPSKFYSQYVTRQSASNQSSSTNTTSFSFGTKETVGQKFTYKVPEVAEITADLKASAQTTHDNKVAKKFNTYTSQEFDVSTQTGFSDVVWFTAKRFNIYLYQVLGQCLPASGNPASDGCPAGTRPLFVQFSGPDNVLQQRIDGNLLEWYQPVQEPGNVFSYPWSGDLLKQHYPGFKALTPDPATIWSTDSSGSTVSVTWSEGSGQTVTSGSVATQSFDASVSASAKVKIEGFGGSTSSLGFQYNQSDSVSTLNESSSTLGSSTGIKIVKPPFANPAQYAYAAQLYIFGQAPPDGTLQQVPVNADVKSTGPLWTGFAADPTDIGGGAGAWWTQAYTRPDVAVYHSSRWTWTPPTTTTGDVLSFNDANRSEPADSEFYFMKGLYITPAGAGGQGPQIVQATAGDVIQLQARVYNYSLADMPAGTTVHARFYGQQWNNNTHEFQAKAFVIGEVSLDPIPRFNSTSAGGAHPNWALATTTFDTSGHADTYLVFWVAVWMARNGQLVPEVAGHGLTAIPPPGIQPEAIAIERYSNNVGFYNQPFFVAPASTAAQPAPTAEAFEVTKVSASPSRLRVFGRTTIDAVIATGHAAVDSVLVVFYDGDPDRDGQAFDVEMVPHIRADDTYTTRVRFQPRTCGAHTIFVTADAGSGATAVNTTAVTVECEPDGIELQGKAEKIASGKADGRVRLSGAVPIVGTFDLTAGMVTVTSLLQEIGGAELVRGAGGAPLLPVTLAPRRGSKPSGAIFETPAGASPSFKVELKQRDFQRPELEFSVTVEGATIPRTAQGCDPRGGNTLTLASRFSIASTHQEPVVMSAERPWRCGKNELKTP